MKFTMSAAALQVGFIWVNKGCFFIGGLVILTFLAGIVMNWLQGSEGRLLSFSIIHGLGSYRSLFLYNDKLLEVICHSFFDRSYTSLFLCNDKLS